MTTTITLEPVTRIEGHAKITLDCDEAGAVVRGHLHVLELRGFEKLVEGMELAKMPLVTGRICGVCPAAHHLASVIAIENGCGVNIPDEARLLRELLYMGHILHSHALSCFVLVGPDLLADPAAEHPERSIFRLLADQPEIAKKALRLRSIGQKIVEKVGGRGIHPVTAVPGGMSCRPSPEDMTIMEGWGREALELLDGLYPVMAEKFAALGDLRALTALPMKAAAMSNNGTVDFLGGAVSVHDAAGKQNAMFSGDDYDKYLIEKVMPGSYMKSVHLRSGDSFFVGPLARLLVNKRYATPRAQQLAETFRSSAASRWNAFDAIESRCIEMVYCAERIVDLCKTSRPDTPIMVPVFIGKGTYRSIVEAPRGILIHDYTANEDGRVTSANLIVATQNNYDAIDATITALARNCKTTGDNEHLMDAMEFGVRCFDPCLSCATHVAGRMALQVELCRGGVSARTIRRGELS